MSARPWTASTRARAARVGGIDGEGDSGALGRHHRHHHGSHRGIVILDAERGSVRRRLWMPERREHREHGRDDGIGIGGVDVEDRSVEPGERRVSEVFDRGRRADRERATRPDPSAERRDLRAQRIRWLGIGERPVDLLDAAGLTGREAFEQLRRSGQRGNCSVRGCRDDAGVRNADAPPDQTVERSSLAAE